MGPERWQEIDELFQRAADVPDAGRSAFLERACGADAELREEVESLLSAERAAPAFLESPAGEAAAAEPADAPASALLGARLGPYRVVEEIGRGGMGEVYLAERADEQFRRRVAVKVLKRGLDTEEILRRFRAERQVLANLDHPNICALLDGGMTGDGRPFIVMEHIEGEPIDAFCRARALSTEERLALFCTVCDAVQCAHQHLVVHRDLKPANILVTPDAAPKLLDFGIAKVLEPGRGGVSGVFTGAHERLLTPEYASPEQLRGAPVTTSSDVYSLGVVLYELLTGERPGRAPPGALAGGGEPERPSAAALRPCSGPGPEDGAPAPARVCAPARLSRRLRGDLDNIVLMAMRSEPSRRYASAQQLGDDLRRHLAGLPVHARPDTLHYRAGKFVRRNRVLVAALGALVLALTAGAIVSSAFAVSALRARDSARSEADKATAVTAFLNRMLISADPTGELGPDTTIRQALDAAAARVGIELAESPLVEAAVRLTIGNTYRDLGEYKPAEEHLRRSYQIRLERLGPDHPDTIRSALWLGVMLRAGDQVPEAERMLTGALERARRVLGETDPTIVDCKLHLGMLRDQQNRVAETESLFTEALELSRRVNPPDDPRTLSLMHNVASTLEKRGKLEQAEPMYRQTLALRTRVKGEEDVGTLTTMNNLGLLLQVRGSLDEAGALLGRAVELRRKVLGEDHPSTLTSMNNLAIVLQRGQHLDEAEELYRQVLERRTRVLGPEHRRTVTAMQNLAGLLKDREKYQEAEALLGKAIEAGRRTLGESHPDLLTMQATYGEVLERQGRTAEAELLLRSVLERARAAFPTDHWRVAQFAGRLGRCLTTMERFDEAEPLLRESYEGLKKALGPSNPRTTAAAGQLARHYQMRGDGARAAEFRTLASATKAGGAPPAAGDAGENR